MGLTKTDELYDLMCRKGYPKEFSSMICEELHTDYTAERMIGYIGREGLQPLPDVADEMLAIRSDRDRMVAKHITEHAQGTINRMYRDEGFWEE